MPEVYCIGHNINADAKVKEVVASLDTHFLDGLHAATREFLKRNDLSLKEVRSHAGPASRVAACLWGWRPLTSLEEDWAAIP